MYLDVGPGAEVAKRPHKSLTFLKPVSMNPVAYLL